MDPIVYGEMFILGMLAYAVVSFLEFRKIKKIPMTDCIEKCRITRFPQMYSGFVRVCDIN